MKRSCFFPSRKPFQSLFRLIPFGGGVRGINLPHVLTDWLKTYSSVALEINSGPVGHSLQ